MSHGAEMTTTTAKHVPAAPIGCDSLTNWRDIGGIRTERSHELLPTGLVFRSESLVGVSTSTIDDIYSYEVGVVVDLRSSEEVDLHGRFQDPSVEWLHHPLSGPSWLIDHALDFPDPMAAMYRSMTTDMAEELCRVLEVVAHADVPIVIHCTSGKDRTGVVSALLQTALGVDYGIVSAEYLASAENLVGHMETMKARYPDLANLIPDELKARAGGVEQAWLDGAFESVRTAGTIDAWLANNGMAPHTLEQLRARFFGQLDNAG